ncbi:DsbA family protein [Halalkalicoccus salilacus]|uniref:DsbA family protein n=1 Tax=Halalkalicoccus salilacus TaxID=3117459 RepID=UPI00300F6578
MSLNTPSRRALITGFVATVGGSAYYLRQSDGESTHEATQTATSFHASDQTTAFGIELDGNPIIGSAEAPVDIYYWTDFQCPFCERFERETLPELTEEYVTTNRVRIVFISLPYFGADSMTAAVASKCVWTQVRESESATYWNWHTAVFDEQGEKNSGWASADNLLEITRSVTGIDADRLETCLADRRGEFEAQIEADTERAQSMEVAGTPTFVVFNPDTNVRNRIVGAQPIEQFTKAIKQVENA